MRGMGTIINTLLVALGGLVGLRLRTGLPETLRTTLMHACGVSSMLIGLAGTLARMLCVSADGSLSTRGTLLLVLSLALGGAVGEALRLEEGMDALGERLRTALKAQSDSRFVEGFVNVSLIICVGAMAIVGSIEDGISGDFSLLAAKSVLDMIIAMVFASSYGVGAVCAALAVLVYQGGITLLAVLFGRFASAAAIDVLSLVGNALIVCVGVNIAFGKRFRVASFLPALPVAVALELGLGAAGISLLAI